MSDSEGRFIPFVEDDQGEGIKDFHDIEETPLALMQRQFRTQMENLHEKREEVVLDNVIERLGRIEQRLTHIFGTHVLINGKWEIII